MKERLLRSVRPAGGDAVDLRIREARIVEIGPALVPGEHSSVIDGGGALLLPGLINGHCHIDKTLWGEPWHSHSAGPTVQDRIANERQVLAERALSPARQSERLAREMVALGTTHARTHVDIAPQIGLSQFHGVLQTRNRLHDALDLQIVAFPQLGMLREPGTLELLEQALVEGADVLGGIDPMGVDRDPKGQLDSIFELAARYGKGLDIHLHDPGEMGAVTVEMIAERTARHGLSGKVVISHAFCLAGVGADRRAALLALLREQDIAIMSHGPGGGTPVPPVREISQAGVLVFAGSDGVRDAWGPLNSPDMLERAYLIAYLNGFRDDAGLELTLEMITTAAASVLDFPDYGLKIGDAADLVLVDAQTQAEAVAAHPPRRLVMKRGEIVARDGRCLLD